MHRSFALGCLALAVGCGSYPAPPPRRLETGPPAPPPPPQAAPEPDPFFRSLWVGFEWHGPNEPGPVDEAALLATLALPDAAASELARLEARDHPEHAAEGAELCEPVRALAELAFPDAVIERCTLVARGRDGRLTVVRPGPRHFGRGCRFSRRHRYRVRRSEAEPLALDGPDDLARAIAPVDDPVRALGAVALAFEVDLMEPSGSDARDARIRSVAQETSLSLTGLEGRAYEVEPDGDGFLVRVPASPWCGCAHPLARFELRVSDDGTIERTDRAPEILANALGGPCVD